MKLSRGWFITIGVATALMLSGCSSKAPEPSNAGPEPEYSNANNQVKVHTQKGGVVSGSGSQYSTEVPGGVTSSGKYTGHDGVSKNGIKMIYFSTNRYDLESDQHRRLMRDMPKIKRLAKSGRIRVEGNCDERGTDEYNHALGLKRAKAVRSVLLSNGIPSSKIDIISYGESNPVCTGHSAPCHAKNRRVEITRVR